MDGAGRVYDNIFVERLWRSVKYEEVYLKDYQTPADAQAGLGWYFPFYNEERPHRAHDGRTPAEAYGLRCGAGQADVGCRRSGRPTGSLRGGSRGESTAMGPP